MPPIAIYLIVLPHPLIDFIFGQHVTFKREKKIVVLLVNKVLGHDVQRFADLLWFQNVSSCSSFLTVGIMKIELLRLLIHSYFQIEIERRKYVEFPSTYSSKCIKIRTIKSSSTKLGVEMCSIIDLIIILPIIEWFLILPQQRLKNICFCRTQPYHNQIRLNQFLFRYSNNHKREFALFTKQVFIW